MLRLRTAYSKSIVYISKLYQSCWRQLGKCVTRAGWICRGPQKQSQGYKCVTMVQCRHLGEVGTRAQTPHWLKAAATSASWYCMDRFRPILPGISLFFPIKVKCFSPFILCVFLFSTSVKTSNFTSHQVFQNKQTKQLQYNCCPNEVCLRTRSFYWPL